MEIQETSVSYCQACGKDFKHLDIVYFAVWDNNIVCQKCAEAHHEKELRVYVDGEKARGNRVGKHD